VEKQSQIILDSQGFFASRLALERPPREGIAIPAAEILRHPDLADLAKRSQISSVFGGFFSSRLAMEPLPRRLSSMPEGSSERVGSFSWQILK